MKKKKEISAAQKQIEKKLLGFYLLGQGASVKTDDGKVFDFLPGTLQISTGEGVGGINQYGVKIQTLLSTVKDAWVYEEPVEDNNIKTSPLEAKQISSSPDDPYDTKHLICVVRRGKHQKNRAFFQQGDYGRDPYAVSLFFSNIQH